MTSHDTATEPPGAQRRAFVRAFVQQTWAKPGAERPLARPHVVLMVAMACAVGSLVVGVALQVLHPSRSTVAGAPPVVASPNRWVAVSGWDCTGATDRGFDAQGRTGDWYTVATGGWGRDGCHGTFEAIPMTGNATTDDRNQTATWWFTPGSTMSTCDIEVYVPDGDHPQDSAAAAAQYYVLSGRSGTAFAQFQINQTQNRGTWLAVGSFPVSSSGIAVRLVDRGVPGTPSARLAVTQIKVSCRN